MSKIIYNKVEYKDKLIVRNYFSPSFMMRVYFLFCTNITFEHEIFTKEIMPDHQAVGHIQIQSVLDKIKGWYWNKRGYGQMVAPSDVKEVENVN